MTESWTGAGDHPEPDAQSRQSLPEGAAQPVAAAPRGTPEGHRGVGSVSSFSGSYLCSFAQGLGNLHTGSFGRDSRMSLAPPPG